MCEFACDSEYWWLRIECFLARDEKGAKKRAFSVVVSFLYNLRERHNTTTEHNASYYE